MKWWYKGNGKFWHGPRLMCIGVLYVIEGLILIGSLGIYQSHLTMKFLIWELTLIEKRGV